MKICVHDHLSVRYGDARDSTSASGFCADRILQALLADLCRLQRVEVSLLRDPAQPPLRLPAAVRLIACPPQHAPQILEANLPQADAIWPVAPETARMLELASDDVLRRGKALIGSDPDAVRIFASKHATARLLRAAGIPTVETFRSHEPMPALPKGGAQGWVVKPDDGAGCSDTHIFPDRDAAGEWIAERGPARYVLQPYIHGRPRSISMVCAAGRVLLMSVDEQRMAVFDNQLHYLGSTVSGADELHREARTLAERVMATVPGLWGYAGIDFITGREGPVVLEVNPRVTLAHAGMRQSLGHNPARLVVELLRDSRCAAPQPKRRRPVSVAADAFAEHAQAGR